MQQQMGLKQILQEAQKCDTRAQNKLGFVYIKGQNVKQDFQLAELHPSPVKRNVCHGYHR